MTSQSLYAQASIKTADNLRTIAHSAKARDLSQLSLPEVDAVIDLVAQVIPAGNVPGVILNGLARLPGRKPAPKTVQRDIGLLFRGVEQVLDKAVYNAFFAGPAAIIWGYQNLLKLAGKDPLDAFPEGTWQFYVDYALREDTARHANETHGFDTRLNQHQIRLSAVDRATAWAMAAIYCLHQYDPMLQNEWRERVYTYLLYQITQGTPEAKNYARLYNAWAKQRPYARGQQADPNEDYPTYRRNKFDQFLEDALRDLPAAQRQDWQTQVQQAEQHDLPAYQRQMSILAYLDPGTYGETRTPLALEQAHVGLIYRGHYYLIPACAPGTRQPPDASVVRNQVATIMAHPSGAPPTPLAALVAVKRLALPRLRSNMSPTLIQALDALRTAPILLNHDSRPRELPLAELRQAERGAGDHALTIFDSGQTFVFDQSHIFFDGGWGAALAEILTNEALSWAVYLNALPAAQASDSALHPLACQLSEPDLQAIRQSRHVTPEVGAETDAVDIKAILKLRKLFKQRSDLIRLTVNDLLVLYRAIHAAIYRPSPDLMAALKQLSEDPDARQAAQSALDEITQSGQNPAILIPVDGSQRSPAERLYPMTFDVPLDDLDLLNLHGQTLAALAAYRGGLDDRSEAFAEFNRLQKDYLAALSGFGQVLSRAKEIAVAGESASVGTIKLLAHIPTPLQRLLDQIPSRFDVLNDIIKGREVFSNVGVVAPASTLTRFITAKDDNDKKTLAWGVITDAEGVMRVTLRDFRPHVGLLLAAGQRDLAVRIANDYLAAYANGLNDYIRDLQRITTASRETQLQRPEQNT